MKLKMYLNHWDMIYKSIGEIVEFSSTKNVNGEADVLYGININKFFMPSVAHIIGVDLKKYKVVKKHQFACNRMHVGRDKRLPISMSTSDYNFIVSPAYDVFTVIDDEVLPEYLMLWFRRSEFDRECWFYTDADVRGGLSLNALKAIEIYIPSIEKQTAIVAQYQSITNKIKVNEQICEKLEATAQALYKHWFVDFEFPNEEGQPYKSSGGAMVWNEELNMEIPEGWQIKGLGEISKIRMGQSPKGESYNENGEGTPLINGPVEFGTYFTVKSKWTTEPKRFCEKNDFIMCVRGSTVGKNVISDDRYAIGRGVCSISSDHIFHLTQVMKNNLIDILKDVTGSTFPNLDRKTIESYLVINPKEDVKEIFEQRYNAIDKKIKILNKQIVRLLEFKSLLLSRLATLEGVN